MNVPTTGLILSILANMILKNKKLGEWWLYFIVKDFLFSAGTWIKNGAMLNMLMKCVSVNKWVW